LLKKLSDSAKAQRFIPTRYGEGYISAGANETSLITNYDAYLVEQSNNAEQTQVSIYLG